MGDDVRSIGAVIARMDDLLAPLEASGDEHRHFLATYRRTTIAVAADMGKPGFFLDPEWLERWDVVFADLYLDALDQFAQGQSAPGPWAVAFEAGTDHQMPPVRHVLLGMNAHINYDLPLALIGAITDDEFADPAVVALRGTDHARIDEILVSRVADEDKELQAIEEPGDRTWLDRLLTPFNRTATKRFMKEARRKVWRNARLLSEARRRGPDALEVRRQELEALSRQRVAELRAPGQVIIRLAAKGFGVELSA